MDFEKESQSNAAKKITWYQKGHYQLKTYDPVTGEWENTKTVYRGADKRDRFNRHPGKQILDMLMDGEARKINLNYTHGHLQRLKRWRIAMNAKSTSMDTTLVRPGEMVLEDRVLRINNRFIPIKNLAEYKKIKGRENKNLYPILFERYLDDGPDFFIKMLNENKLLTSYLEKRQTDTC